MLLGHDVGLKAFLMFIFNLIESAISDRPINRVDPQI
jgi:hypothetical protein